MTRFQFLGFQYRTNADASRIEVRIDGKWEQRTDFVAVREAHRALFRK